MHHSFDTYGAVKRAMLSGMKEEQAEVIVKIISESREYDLSNLATQVGLMETEKKLESKIHEVEQRLESKIHEVEQRLDNKINGVEQRLGAQISALAIEVANVRGDIEKSKSETLKWFIGIAITLVGTMTGIMALLLRYFLQ